MSDAVLDTLLHSRSLIEASAGTGKTYALAGLFARAVIVERRRVPQVLAVTYTVAATQELHARVRLRLQRATELAAHWRDGDPAQLESDNAETALLRHLLHIALHDATRESLPALRLRLNRAVRDMDLAAIATIHGFCQRVLSEHALDTGEPLVAAELQPDNTASRRQLAVELWREFSVETDGAEFLRRTFSEVDSLAVDLRDLLTPEPLLPPAPSALPPDPRPAFNEAWRALRSAFAAHGEQAHADIVAAIVDKTLKNTEYKPDHVDSLWSWLHAVSGADTAPSSWHGKCAKYTPAALLKGTSKDGAGRTPRSPLFEAMATMLVECETIAPWREAGDLQRLHALRERARERDHARKQAFNVRGYDDLVGAVFDAVRDPHAGPRLAQALREQFPLVLVDEFQDTDARQWAIFESLFGAGGLVLVGDPKQAIYRFRGGDVHTYLQARGSVEAAARLERNFRSRPCVLEAVNALFAEVPDHALGDGIVYAATTPGDQARDQDYLSDAQPAPALAVHVVPDNNGKAWSKDESIAIAAMLCAQAIRDRLRAARDGRLTRRDQRGLRALEPRDCAVLVRTHVEAIAVRTQLARLGVPAVAAGRQSLFATESAQELLTLLLALAAPGDERRLRAALATRLLGFDATRLRALEDDGDALRDWQRRFDDWRLRWQQHGPQAMLADVVAQQAARMLALADGERQLTHLLQLGELMQEARASASSMRGLGTQGQLDWLRAAIANADKDDEAQLPRLESDASRVQILTLHTSKGLEFPLVFLPFVGIGRGNGSESQFVSYHDAAGVRVRQWKTTLDHPGALSWPDASAQSKKEEREEDMRLLYVGLTRARDALWLCSGALASAEKTALYRLFNGNTPDQNLRDVLGAQLELGQGLPDFADIARLPPSREAAVPPARAPHRRLHRGWWIHSFSQLHKQRPHGTQALVDEMLAETAPASDERPLAAVAALPRDLRFSGERFGNVLHHALEHADFAAWRDHFDDAPPPGQEEVLRRALQSQDYRDSDVADGIRALTPLVAATLNAPLPGRDWNDRTRLCDLSPAQRIAELEFHFSLDDASTAALLALLHTHGIAGDRRDFGVWPRLAGLMTGKIDLTYRIDGRIYILDYKSNYLPEYDADSLQQAMAAHEYDLQALLYAVAVHRWLRLRLGAAYDFDLHFGGVRYLFCRGLRREEPASGMVVPHLPHALIAAVDELLSPSGGRA